MPRKKYANGLLLAILVVIVYDNLPVLPFQYHETTSVQSASNSDITNGALSRLDNMIYVFQFQDGDTRTFGNGDDSVIMKQRGDFRYGLGEYIPFYKRIRPNLVFDCYIARDNKYIGKIEIQERFTMTGLTNRAVLKKAVRNMYLNRAVNVLNTKAISYEELAGSSPVIGEREAKTQMFSAGSGLDGTSPRINVMLNDWEHVFSRSLPIRQRDSIYTDTIFFNGSNTDPRYPLYEVYQVNKPKRLLTYSSYNAARQIIYSKMFKLEAVYEGENPYYFHSYGVYNLEE